MRDASCRGLDRGLTPFGFSGLRLSRVMGSTPSIDLQDAAIRCKLKDMRVLTDAIEDGGQAMDINEQDDGLGYSALTEAVNELSGVRNE